MSFHLAAIECIAKGWPVIPAEPGGRRLLVPLRDATLSRARVANWASSWPEANLAVATGLVSGVCAISAAGPTGRTSIVAHDFPDTSTVVVGTFWMRLYSLPDRPTLRNVQRILPGVNFLAEGGYLLVPPSRLADGDWCRWQAGGPTARLPEAPAWLLRLALEGQAFREAPWSGRICSSTTRGNP